MSDFLQQMLNDEEHNRKLTDAMNRADIEKWKELTRRLNQEELIPATPELNRLKEFLASFKKPTLLYAGEDHFVVGLGPEEEKWKRIAGY